MFGLITQGNIIGAVALLIAVVFSIVMHELAHGQMAMWCGDKTAKYMGRMTLNPLSHFDPFGFLMLAVVGFGWAKPVPINPLNFRKYRKGLFLVSIAGVALNFILAFLVYPLYLTAALHMPAATAVAGNLKYFITSILMYTVSINLSLCVFNLLPIYPLDGFRLVETFAKHGNRYVNFMYRYGMFVLIGVLVMSELILQLFNFSLLGFLWNIVGWPIMSFWNLLFGL